MDNSVAYGRTVTSIVKVVTSAFALIVLTEVFLGASIVMLVARIHDPPSRDFVMIFWCLISMFVFFAIVGLLIALWTPTLPKKIKTLNVRRGAKNDVKKR